MKKIKNSIFITVILLAVVISPVLAQSESLTLSMSRDWGYGGFGNDIQGTFTIRAKGTDDLQSVRFYIDDELMNEDTEAPFAFQFNTDDYPAGLHTLTAVGTLTDGSEVESSNPQIRTFVAAADVPQLIGPILGVAGVIAVLSLVIPMVLGRNKKPSGQIGEYSMAGPAVCKQCQLPFSRKVMSPNVVMGKLERCPHCGKWQLAMRAGGDELVAAEKRLFKDNNEGQIEDGKSEEDRLRDQLDASRFDG